jgi:hypothetical protein
VQTRGERPILSVVFGWFIRSENLSGQSFCNFLSCWQVWAHTHSSGVTSLFYGFSGKCWKANTVASAQPVDNGGEKTAASYELVTAMAIVSPTTSRKLWWTLFRQTSWQKRSTTSASKPDSWQESTKKSEKIVHYFHFFHPENIYIQVHVVVRA